MKKFIYFLLVACAMTVTIAGCTEEDVAPVANTYNGGGNANEDTYGNANNGGTN